MIIEKTREEDDWKARNRREFGTTRQAKPASDTSSKDSPKSSSPRYS